MSIRARLKALSLPQLFKLARLFLKNPGYVFLTARASKKALQIATTHYGDKHHKSNPANAFRHALWTVLLGQAVYQRTGSLREAQNWAKQFTDLHEELFVNRKAARTMDLHNNSFGIQALRLFAAKPQEEAVMFLQEAAKNAVQIRNAKDAEAYPNKLIYLSK